jgi:polysaccharide export outer membrane protein
MALTHRTISLMGKRRGTCVWRVVLGSVALIALSAVGLSALTQTSTKQPPGQKPPDSGTSSVPAAVTPGPDYIIGAEDVLTVVFWREKDMSGDLTVRPDGKISLPLVNDVQAAGLTPEQLRLKITEAAAKYIEEPTVTVVVKTINSRKVFIMGQVGKPGPYPLSGPMTVIQLLALAGGPLEFADADQIVIMRTENGKTTSFPFNYKHFVNGRDLKQNIDLKPGDTVVVP